MSKHIKNFLQWLLSHAITVFSCVAIIALGMGAVAYSSTSTTIGENISTGGTLTVSSDSTLATTTISGGDLIVDTDTLYVDSTNNRVGIGTTAPQDDLEIYSNNGSSAVINLRAPANGTFYMGQRSGGTLSNPTVSSGSLVGLGGGGYNGSDWVSQKVLINLKTDGSWTTSSNPTKITFNTTPVDGIVTSEKMVIDNSGRVGIGTTGPGSNLDINSATGGVMRLTYNDSNGSATDYSTLGVGASGLTTLTTVDSDGALGHIALMPDGNVGIGTTSPAYKLDVNEAVRANDYYSGDYSQGLTTDVVVKGSDGNDCILTYKDGLLTAETCP